MPAAADLSALFNKSGSFICGFWIADNNGRKRARETGSSVDLELSKDLCNKARRAL